ncbi:hypothetical protein ACVIQS_004277 [Bradyrhizobium diazoefficiens]
MNASLHVLAEKPKIFPLDLRISTQYFRARILWLQGLADQAQALAARTIEEGLANGHALTFCSVLGQAACPIAFWAGDFDARGTARHGAARTHRATRDPAVGPVGTRLQRGSRCQARRRRDRPAAAARRAQPRRRCALPAALSSSAR